MAKSQNYTTPKRKARGGVRNGQRVSKPVSAMTSQTVVGNGPEANSQQELILEVKAGAQEFLLHPSTIPWLAGVAPSHQEWCLAGVKMWYEPRVGTSTAGTVAVALLEDFQDTKPTTLPSLTRISGSRRGAPWTPFVLQSPRNRWVPYVSASVFDALDPVEKSLRSPGRVVYFADSDATAGTVLGNIFLSYNPQGSVRKPTDPGLQG